MIDELNVEPIVHTYVYNEEMLDSLLRKLVSDGLIHVMEYDDFLNSELDEQYYEDLFKDMYYYCNMERIVEQKI